MGLSKEVVIARLSITTLGPLQISVNGLPATGFDSDKVRALLVYLAVEADLPHRRERLAGLLWPEFTERAARTNLRRSLANLRQIIGDIETDSPHLLVTPQTIQFQSSGNFELDVRQFRSPVEDEFDIEALEKIGNLYKGDFLEGFSIPDSPEFENWTLITREALRSQKIWIQYRLATFLESQGKYEKATLHIRQLLHIDPYHEEAHQQMMRLLALNGQRAEALEHFDSLSNLLREDLQISPSQETISLYDQIRSSKVENRQETALRRMIRGYELCERIGTGKYGAVYRANQTIVAREVAIKVIFPHYIDQPDFIRHFETEAQIIAHLEHPYIVPLYDYWREPGGAYLVMRWMRGGNLKSSLSRGPWKVDQVLHIVEQVASALALAHRQGVIHRDIKPANILLDEDNNAFLSDFGLATLIDPILVKRDTEGIAQFANATGSLGYQPPEVIQEGRISPEADIYSLGVMLYELLVGEHPFPELSGQELIEKHLSELLPSIRLRYPEIPDAVDEVIQQATAKDPSQRFLDPIRLASAFRNALSLGSHPAFQTISVSSQIQNPYKGLRPFNEADALHFFGRETLILRLIECLSEDDFGNRFLTVLGPSGSGKSSLVKAGVIPALRKGVQPGSDQWFIVEMRPGDHPFEALETALLRIAVNPPETMLNLIQESPRGLIRAVEHTLPQDERIELLLVIDQLEELFTLVEDQSTIRRFLDMIYSAVTDVDSRLRVITTLRADYYDQPLQYPVFAELVRNRTEVVTPMTTRELERAIREPARMAGISIEEGLIATILSEFNEQPGALPLFQYLMTELFEHRDDDQLTQTIYEEIGGMRGALSSRAEGLYHELTALEKEAAHQMFLRLVVLREDIEDTNHRVLRSELESISLQRPSIVTGNSLNEGQRTDEIRENMGNVIELFGKYRLLTFDRDPQTREPTVQIAHQALISEWRRLREWLDESRADKHMQRVLMNETTEWLDAERDPSFLLRGTQLDTFEAWVKDTILALSQVELEFIHASLADRRDQEAAEMTRLAHERALENRSRKFLRALAAVFAASTILAIIFSVILFQQRNIAQSESRIVISRELAQASLTSMKADPQLGLLLALQAVENTKATDDIVIPEAEDALHRAVLAAQSRLRHDIKGPGSGRVNRIAYHPSGTILADSYLTSPTRPNTEVKDISTGETLLQLPGYLLTDVWLDGDRLATIYLLDKSTVRINLWSSITGEEITNQIIQLSTETKGYEGYFKADMSPDGRRLALAWEDINNNFLISVWDLDADKEIFILHSTGLERRYYAGMSDDGKQLIAAEENGRIIIYDLEHDSERLSIQAHNGLVTHIRFSHDGLLFVSASIDRSIKLWDSETGQELSTWVGHDNVIDNVAINPDGTLLASAYADGIVKLWDLKASLASGSGVELFTLPGYYNEAKAVVFSPDGNHLIIGGFFGQLREWDISPSHERFTLVFDPLKDDTNPVYLEINPHGDRLMVMSYGTQPSVWDTQTGELLYYLASTHTENFSKAAYTPDGKSIIGVFDNGTIAQWDAQDGKERFEYSEYSDAFYTIDTSPDGNFVAVGNQQGLIRMLSLQALLQAGLDQKNGPVEIYNIPANEWVSDIEFSPDEKSLGATGFYGEGGGRPAEFWQVDSGKRTGLELHGWGWKFISLAFNADNKLLATTSIDDPAMIWDAISGEQLFNLTGHDGITAGVAFSPDGSRLATVSIDGTTKIWSVTDRKELFTLHGHTAGITDVVFSPDGSILYTASWDGTVRAYLMDIDDLIALGKERITRQLTDEECLRYLHLNTCP